jgi:hypothetical protein
MKHVLALAGALLLAPIAPACAQQVFPSVIAGSFQVSATTTSSTPAALPSTSPIYGTITLYNESTHDAFCALGASGALATTSSPDLVPAGKALRVAVGGGAYVACITAASTATVDVYQSNGPIDLQ